jgi:hypothetical protein
MGACRFGKIQALLTDIQALNEGQIALGVTLAEIVEQSTTLSDQREETSATGIVFVVRPHMLGESIDASGQDGDLNLGRPGVLFVALVIPNDFLLPLFRDRHVLPYSAAFANFTLARPAWAY